MNRPAVLAVVLAASLLTITSIGHTQQDATGSLPRVSELFPADADWQPIGGGGRTTDTRYGELSTGPGERCSPTGEPFTYVDIRLDERSIGAVGCSISGDYYLNFFSNRYELGGMDVIVMSSDAGGSGSPPPRLHLIVLPPDAVPWIEADELFRSADGIQNVTQDGDQLWFDLGFVDGLRRVAVFDGTSLQVSARAVSPEPMLRDRCRVAFETLGSCTAAGRGRDNRSDLFGLGLREIMRTIHFPTAASRPLGLIMQDPGFSPDSYAEACAIAAQTQSLPDYESFAETACTP